MEAPVARFDRKVIDLNNTTTSPKVSIPRWWLAGAREVVLEVYGDKLVIRKKGV